MELPAMPEERADRVLPLTRLALVLGLLLAVVAGVQLFLLSHRTAEFFAWTVGAPVTAAFLGAGYWSTLPSLALALRMKQWLEVRVLLVAVLVFCLFVAFATLAHLNLFHLSSAGLVARGAAWAWLIVYFGLPWLIVVALVLQERMGGAPDSDPAQPMPGWVRAWLVVIGLILTLLGLTMTLAPSSVAAFWPWPLTPLTGRAIGAWWLILATCAWWGVRVGDWRQVRSAMPFLIAFFLLQILTVVRFRAVLAGDWRAWAYVGGLVLFLCVTAIVALHQGRAGRTRYAATARTQPADM
jgi:hypothetical protein